MPKLTAMESATSTTDQIDAAGTAAEVAAAASLPPNDPMPELLVQEESVAPPPPLPDDGPGHFEIFFNNPENVPLDKQMPYIMMMATDCIDGTLWKF